MASGTPRFRRHLPHTAISEGEYRYVDLAKNDGPVRLYDFEYALALELDGRPFHEIAEVARHKLGMELDAEKVEAFAGSLRELGLIEAEEEVVPAPAASNGPWPSEQGEPTTMMQGMSELLAVATRPETGEASNDGIPHVVGLGSQSEEITARAVSEASGPGVGDAPPDGVTGAVSDKPTSPAAPAPAASSGGTRWLVWALLGLVAAAIAGFALWKFVLSGSDASPISVRTVVPQPESVYRFFPDPGTVQAAEPNELTSPGAGTVIEVLAAGTSFAAGDTLLALDTARPSLREIAHLRERIAYYEEMLAAMEAENNRPEARQAEIKLREKQRLLLEQTTLLRQHALIANEPGRIAATLVEVGARVRPGQPALRVESEGLPMVFSLPAEAAREAARLSFCRVELSGTTCACRLVGGEGLGVDDDAESGGRPDARAIVQVVAVLDADCPAEVGATGRLARTRYDGVFSVPARAIVRLGEADRIFVAAPTGRSELRAVLLAETSNEASGEVLVAQGLDVGDQVIVDADAHLLPNARVKVTERIVR